MKLQITIKWLVGLVTLASVLAAMYSWHVKEKQAAAETAATAAVNYEKRIQGHSQVHSSIVRVFREGMENDLNRFVNSLPGKKSYQKVRRSWTIAFEKDSKNRTLDATTFSFKLKDKTFVEFQIVGGYFRDHLDPHVFEIRYTDSPNNKAAVKFVENLFKTKFIYKPVGPEFEHEIVESISVVGR